MHAYIYRVFIYYTKKQIIYLVRESDNYYVRRVLLFWGVQISILAALSKLLFEFRIITCFNRCNLA